MRLPDGRLSRAVVIGISEYSDENLPPLEAVSETVAALHATLTDPVHGILPPEHCTLLDNEGDLRRIGSALRTAAADAEDLLLVYYSGHGLIGGIRQDLYLALCDSDFEAPEFNSLEYDKLRSAVLASPARTKVIILDCCFAGRALSAAMAGPDGMYIGQMEIGGTYVLTAAPRDKVALILEGERHTAFTGRLLELLTEGAPGGAELLTIDEIYRLLYHRMTSEGLPRPQKHGTLNADELALARNRAFIDTAAPALKAEQDAAWSRALNGDWSGAEPILRDIHARQERILGAENADTLITLQYLALCACALGDPERGAAALSDLLPVQMRVLGPDDTDTLATRQFLAVAVGEDGAREEAVAQLRTLLPDRRRVLGPEHEQVLRTIHMLARNLVAVGEYEEAQALLREVVAARVRILGPEHPHTARSQADLRLLGDVIPTNP